MNKIIGYINHNKFLPCCVIIVCQKDEEELFCSYPNGDKIPIEKEKLSLTKEEGKFISEKNTQRTFNENDVAYLFPSGEVFVGDKNGLKKRLELELAKPDMPVKEKGIIVDFIKNSC